MNLIWDENGLLSSKTEVDRSERAANDKRNEFQSDYSRILFSSPFRRLQDKAQVFPLDNSDFVRTRLTHSLEVASIARSMGVSVEGELIQNSYISEKNYIMGQIPTILECAGIAHDLGNPPFGHFGEETIRNVFKEEFSKGTGIELTEEQKNDFLYFDGNCQAIRILTRLQCINDMFGMHLTYATLATLMKYPMNSTIGNKKTYDDNKHVSYKKFGYFQSEKEVYEKIVGAIGTKVNEGEAKRHPLSMLLEAADDIAYSAGDLEDGFKKKAITINNIREVFEGQDEVLKKLDEYLSQNQYSNIEKAIQRFRIYLQGKMISAVIKSFIEKQSNILSGEFDEELLLISEASEIRKALKELAEKYILCDNNIYKTELAGESIISFLVKFFIGEVANKGFIHNIIEYCKEGKYSIKGKMEKAYKIISVDYRIVFEKRVTEIINENIKINSGVLKEGEIQSEVLYNIYLLITDYISCMTDNYSVELYRRLKGIIIN